MTIEELDIVIKANVEQALKEVHKLVPDIQKASNQISQTLQNVKTGGFVNKIKDAVNNAVSQLRRVSKSDTEVQLKANTKEAQKQITQLEKQIDALEQKTRAKQLRLDAITPQIDAKVDETRKAFTAEGLEDSNATDSIVDSQLASDKTFTALASEAEKLAGEIDDNNSKLSLMKAQLASVRSESEKLNSSANGTGSIFEKIGSKIRGLGGHLGQATGKSNIFKKSVDSIGTITHKVSGKIKTIGNGFKSGLGHVLKYAGALFGLRAIYNGLRQASQAWLGSQNAEAQQTQANIEYLKYALGSTLAPVIQWITNLVYSLLKAIQSLVYAFSGVNIFAKATASSMKSTAGSAKQTSKSLAGVHNEINNIQDSEGSGGGGGSASPSMDLSSINTDGGLSAIMEKIQSGDWNAIGATIGEKLNGALASIPWDTIQEKCRNVATGLAQGINGFIASTDWTLVGNTVGQGLNTVVYTSQAYVKNLNFSGIGQAFGKSLNGLFSGFDWGALADTLSQGIKGCFNMISGFFQEFDWSTLLDGLWDFITNIDWGGIVSGIFEALGSACASLVNLGMVIGDYIRQAFEGIGQYFQDKIEECGGNVVLGILKGIGDAVIGIGQWIYDHIFKPFIDGFKKVFGIHSPSTVMEEQGNFIMEGLINGIKALVEVVVSIFEGIRDIIVKIFNAIKDIIVTVWNTIKDVVTKIINTIKDIITKVFNAVKDVITNIWNGIKEFITNVINGIKNIFETVFNTIKNIVTGVFNGIRDVIVNIWNGITSFISNIINGIKNVISGVLNTISSIWNNIWGGIRDTVIGIWDGIWNGIKTYVNFIIGGIEGFVNGVIKAINFLLKGVSIIANSIGSLIGLDPINLEIGQISIPRLAKGNVAYEGTLALFGEYAGAKNNPEITAPQSILKDTFEEVLSKHGSTGQGFTIDHFIVQVGENTIFDDMIEYANDKTIRTGKDVFVRIGG